jgi:hypothetical protein
MTDDIKKKAEEYAEQAMTKDYEKYFINKLLQSVGTGSLFGDYLMEELLYRQREAYLAGAAYARTPIKIDPNDYSTWPPPGTLLGWFGKEFGGLIEIKKTVGEYVLMTHWLPLPLISEGK